MTSPLHRPSARSSARAAFRRQTRSRDARTAWLTPSSSSPTNCACVDAPVSSRTMKPESVKESATR
eukprot:6888963-Pyramimonas_sp.AAC.1